MNQIIYKLNRTKLWNRTKLFRCDSVHKFLKLIRYSSVHFLSKPDSNQLMPPPNLYKQTVLQILTTGMERNGVNWLHERKVITCEHLYRIKEQLKWVLKNQFFHVFTLKLFTSLFNMCVRIALFSFEIVQKSIMIM